jgi:hypothetical protein
VLEGLPALGEQREAAFSQAALRADQHIPGAGVNADFRAATSAPCAWTGSCCYLGFYQCEVALPGAISVTDLALMKIITCEWPWRA